MTGSAAPTAVGPRLTAYRGATWGFVGSAAIALVLTQLVVWNSMPPWVVAAAALSYALALVAWAGLWHRPLHALAAVAASLAGLFCGYVLGILVASLVDTRPEI